MSHLQVSKRLTSLNLSGTEPGEPFTRSPSCTTPRQPNTTLLGGGEVMYGMRSRHAKIAHIPIPHPPPLNESCVLPCVSLLDVSPSTGDVTGVTVVVLWLLWLFRFGSNFLNRIIVWTSILSIVELKSIEIVCRGWVMSTNVFYYTNRTFLITVTNSDHQSIFLFLTYNSTIQIIK